MNQPIALRRAAQSTPKTVSERLFQRYLRSQGVSFEFEAESPGKKARPDFAVVAGGATVYCEVKELHERRPPPSPGTAANFDPYAGVRKEIHEARRQFREYKDHPCVLVLYNVNDWEFRSWPDVLLGAMLGEVGWAIPFNKDRGRLEVNRASRAFGDGGKMVSPKSRRLQNTTFSAIAVLSEYREPNPDFHRELRRRENALARRHSRARSDDGWLGMVIGLARQHPIELPARPRLCTIENPLARIPLPDRFFAGEFDSRHRFDARTRRIERTYAGPGLLRAERLTNGEDDIFVRIERFVRQVVDRFSPQKIVLFGSYASGTADEGSDVDLLVIFPGNADATERALDIRRVLNADFPMDLLTRSSSEVRRRIAAGDSFLREIVDQGRILYEAADR